MCGAIAAIGFQPVRLTAAVDRAWISAIRASVNASTSSGLRLVTMFPSVTAGSSTRIAPALARSVRIDGQQVARRPRNKSASTSSHGPWQIAATGFPAAAKARISAIAAAFVRKRIGIAHSAGKQERVEILDLHVIDREVGADRPPGIVHHRRLDRRPSVGDARLTRAPRSDQNFARAEQLGFLETVGGEDEDVRVGDLRHGTSFLRRSLMRANDRRKERPAAPQQRFRAGLHQKEARPLLGLFR